MGFYVVLCWIIGHVGDNILLLEMGIDWWADNDPTNENLPFLRSKSDPKIYVFPKEQISTLWDHIMEMFSSPRSTIILSLYGRCGFIHSLSRSDKRMVVPYMETIHQEKFINVYFVFLCQQNGI